MKAHARTWLLTLTVGLILASCGGNGASGDGEDKDAGGTNSEPMRTEQAAEETGKSEETGGMGDMKGMDHGPGGMATGMLMEDGEYSDERFLEAMSVHHKGAVQMARIALKRAEHEEIKGLAEDIVRTQQAEIKQMKSIKKQEFGSAGMSMEVSPGQMKGMGMMANPSMIAKEKPFDKAFIDQMIMHHESAIEMARVAADQSDIPEIRDLAKSIIEAQESEIEQMKSWRDEWYPEG